mgnify:CR=1 FL=1
MGIGAIGSWLCENLVADNRGQWNITVLDFDKVAERNIVGTQRYFIDDLDFLKTEALQLGLYKALGKEISILSYKLTEFNVKGIIKDYDLIVDTFDNFDARRVITMASRGIVECLHVGFSENMTFAIEWNDNYQVPSDITSNFDVCTLPGASSFIKFVASLGALTVEEFLFNNKKFF